MGKYIHKVCHLHERESEIGHYFGMFNSIFFVNSVLGGVVVTFGLEIMSHQNYFILVTCISGLAFLFAASFIRNIKYEEAEKAGEGDESEEEEEKKPTMTWN